MPSTQSVLIPGLFPLNRPNFITRRTGRFISEVISGALLELLVKLLKLRRYNFSVSESDFNASKIIYHYLIAEIVQLIYILSFILFAIQCFLSAIAYLYKSNIYIYICINVYNNIRPSPFSSAFPLTVYDVRFKDRLLDFYSIAVIAQLCINIRKEGAMSHRRKCGTGMRLPSLVFFSSFESP